MDWSGYSAQSAGTPPVAHDPPPETRAQAESNRPTELAVAVPAFDSAVSGAAAPRLQPYDTQSQGKAVDKPSTTRLGYSQPSYLLRTAWRG